MYYINPNTNEVHRRGACSWQYTIADWVLSRHFLEHGRCGAL